MAVTLNANSSTGFIATSDTSGVLQLQTGGTAAVTVDASQNVGIGTASPATKLDVSGGSIRVNEDGAGTKIITVRSNYASLGPAINVTTNDPLLVLTNNTERMRVLTTGNILSLSGGSTTATGTGIAFPATQSASSDANTLDDYEEGTWTPTLANQGTMTFTIRLGSYTKVGNLVVASFHIDVNTTGTGSGVLGITNLPFVVKNASGQYGFITSVHAYTWTTARSNINGLANPGNTTCDFYYGAAGTGGATQPTIADLGAGNFLASVVYLAE
jgi:hypothetical protein